MTGFNSTVAVLIEDAQEVLEHATMAYAGLEYLRYAMEDDPDQLIADELSATLKPDYGSTEDGVDALLGDLAFLIARKATYVYRLGHGLPNPKKENQNWTTNARAQLVRTISQTHP